MAVQLDVNEIQLSEYQASVFLEAENILRNDGYLGEDLFEDTYVLQKAMVEYLVMNVPLNGSTADIQSTAREVYNEVLDITPITPEPTPEPVGSPRRTGSPRRSGTRGRLRNGVGPEQPNIGNPRSLAPQSGVSLGPAPTMSDSTGGITNQGEFAS
jgi:hypothetical protein